MSIWIVGNHEHDEIFVKIDFLVSDSDHYSTTSFNNFFIQKRIHNWIDFFDISYQNRKTESQTLLQNLQKIVILKIGFFNISIRIIREDEIDCLSRRINYQRKSIIGFHDNRILVADVVIRQFVRLPKHSFWGFR